MNCLAETPNRQAKESFQCCSAETARSCLVILCLLLMLCSRALGNVEYLDRNVGKLQFNSAKASGIRNQTKVLFFKRFINSIFIAESCYLSQNTSVVLFQFKLDCKTILTVDVMRGTKTKIFYLATKSHSSRYCLPVFANLLMLCLQTKSNI